MPTAWPAATPGGSHVIFPHASGARLSVPAHRSIKPIYVKKFVRLVEDGVAE
jgi:predicted RNA binding protein YcfA (HicA-like mRNA interferase family)